MATYIRMLWNFGHWIVDDIDDHNSFWMLMLLIFTSSIFIFVFLLFNVWFSIVLYLVWILSLAYFVRGSLCCTILYLVSSLLICVYDFWISMYVSYVEYNKVECLLLVFALFYV